MLILSCWWRRFLIGAIAVLCALGLSLNGGSAQTAPLVATVDYAKSGHTLELLSELSTDIPVMQIRLMGIEAPDGRQEPWGPAARTGLAELARGLVRVEPQSLSPDEYDRLWAYVWSDKQLINAEILAQGWAYLDSDRLSQLRYGERLLYAQEEARLLGRGIWHPDLPLRQTPAHFRETLTSP